MTKSATAQTLIKTQVQKRKKVLHQVQIRADRQGQLSLLQTTSSLQYGGVLRNKAKNRGARPLSTKESIHVVLRSSKAKKEWSFRHPKNQKRVQNFVTRFSAQKGVELIKVANVGNHFHLQVRIPSRTLYKAWIRGLSAGIAVMVAGHKGLQKLKQEAHALRVTARARQQFEPRKTTCAAGFWDYRPFTRVIRGLRAFLTTKDYIAINQLEGEGLPRTTARQWVWDTSLLNSCTLKVNFSSG